MNNENNVESILYAVGTRGYSAYEVAVQNGFVGTEQEWLDSLVGPQGELGPEGKSAYEIAVENGYSGTEEEWVNDFLTPDGYYNKQEIDDKIVDDLSTSAVNKMLSANQGRVLKGICDDLNDHVSTIDNALEERVESDYLEENYYTKNDTNDIINTNMADVNVRINSLASGAPLVASSTSEMTDTTKVYVNTTDGYWYSYNGTAWVQRGVYQATELADESVGYSKLDTTIKTAVGEIVPSQLTLSKQTANLIDVNNILMWGQGNSRNNSVSTVYYKEKIYISDTQKFDLGGRLLETLGSQYDENNIYARLVCYRDDDTYISQKDCRTFYKTGWQHVGKTGVPSGTAYFYVTFTSNSGSIPLSPKDFVNNVKFYLQVFEGDEANKTTSQNNYVPKYYMYSQQELEDKFDNYDEQIAAIVDPNVDFITRSTATMISKDAMVSLQKEQGQSFTFIVQTDTHSTLNELNGHVDRYNNIKNMSNYIGLDFICNLGDIIEGYQYSTYSDMQKVMTELISRYVENVNCPVLLCVGNHDDNCMWTKDTNVGSGNNSLDEILLPAEQYARIIKPIKNTGEIVDAGKLYYYIDFDEIRVIVLNTRDVNYTYVPGINTHRIGDEQVDWLQNVALNTNKKIIILSHVPLTSQIGTDTLGNRDVVQNILNTYQTQHNSIIGCFCGHVHRQISAVENGILYVCFPNAGYHAEIVMVDTTNRVINTKTIGTNEYQNRHFEY